MTLAAGFYGLIPRADLELVEDTFAALAKKEGLNSQILAATGSQVGITAFVLLTVAIPLVVSLIGMFVFSFCCCGRACCCKPKAQDKDKEYSKCKKCTFIAAQLAAAIVGLVGCVFVIIAWVSPKTGLYRTLDSLQNSVGKIGTGSLVLPLPEGGNRTDGLVEKLLLQADDFLATLFTSKHNTSSGVPTTLPEIGSLNLITKGLELTKGKTAQEIDAIFDELNATTELQLTGIEPLVDDLFTGVGFVTGFLDVPLTDYRTQTAELTYKSLDWLKEFDIIAQDKCDEIATLYGAQTTDTAFTNLLALTNAYPAIPAGKLESYADLETEIEYVIGNDTATDPVYKNDAFKALSAHQRVSMLIDAMDVTKKTADMGEQEVLGAALKALGYSTDSLSTLPACSDPTDFPDISDPTLSTADLLEYFFDTIGLDGATLVSKISFLTETKTTATDILNGLLDMMASLLDDKQPAFVKSLAACMHPPSVPGQPNPDPGTAEYCVRDALQTSLNISTLSEALYSLIKYLPYYTDYMPAIGNVMSAFSDKDLISWVLGFKDCNSSDVGSALRMMMANLDFLPAGTPEGSCRVFEMPEKTANIVKKFSFAFSDPFGVVAGVLSFIFIVFPALLFLISMCSLCCHCTCSACFNLGCMCWMPLIISILSMIFVVIGLVPHIVCSSVMNPIKDLDGYLDSQFHHVSPAVKALDAGMKALQASLEKNPAPDANTGASAFDSVISFVTALAETDPTADPTDPPQEPSFLENFISVLETGYTVDIQGMVDEILATMNIPLTFDPSVMNIQFETKDENNVVTPKTFDEFMQFLKITVTLDVMELIKGFVAQSFPEYVSYLDKISLGPLVIALDFTNLSLSALLYPAAGVSVTYLDALEIWPLIEPIYSKVISYIRLFEAHDASSIESGLNKASEFLVPLVKSLISSLISAQLPPGNTFGSVAKSSSSMGLDNAMHVLKVFSEEQMTTDVMMSTANIPSINDVVMGTSTFTADSGLNAQFQTFCWTVAEMVHIDCDISGRSTPCTATDYSAIEDLCAGPFDETTDYKGRMTTILAKYNQIVAAFTTTSGTALRARMYLSYLIHHTDGYFGADTFAIEADAVSAYLATAYSGKTLEQYIEILKSYAKYANSYAKVTTIGITTQPTDPAVLDGDIGTTFSAVIAAQEFVVSGDLKTKFDAITSADKTVLAKLDATHAPVSAFVDLLPNTAAYNLAPTTSKQPRHPMIDGLSSIVVGTSSTDGVVVGIWNLLFNPIFSILNTIAGKEGILTPMFLTRDILIDNIDTTVCTTVGGIFSGLGVGEFLIWVGIFATYITMFASWSWISSTRRKRACCFCGCVCTKAKLQKELDWVDPKASVDEDDMVTMENNGLQPMQMVAPGQPMMYMYPPGAVPVPAYTA